MTILSVQERSLRRVSVIRMQVQSAVRADKFTPYVKLLPTTHRVESHLPYLEVFYGIYQAFLDCCFSVFCAFGGNGKHYVADRIAI